MSAPNLQDAIAHHQRGELAAARSIYQAVLAQTPQHFDALHLLGVLSLQTGDAQQAATLIAQALASAPPQPQHADANVNLGTALKALGRLDDALAAFARATTLNPRHAAAHYNRGNLLRTRGDLDTARASFEAALRLRPNDAEASYGLGLILAERGETIAAIAALEAARTGGIATPELDEQLALMMGRAGRAEEAIARFSAVLAARPGDAHALNNRAVLLAGLRRDAEAFADFARAIALKPDFAAAHLNRGVARRVAGDLDGALADFTQAAALDPTSIKALYTLATTFAEQSRHEEASAAYARAFAIDPAHPFLLGTWLYVRMMLCNWHNFDKDLAAVRRMVEEGRKAAPVYALPAMTDDPALQKRAAETWAADRGLVAAPAPQITAHDKIRIAYVSADFRMHPVAQLAAGMFEQHDRSRFEITAFALGPNTKDEMRRRLEGAFDSFIDVHTMSDTDVAALARTHGIDIAVDLTGYTGGSRPGIFAQRAAPVQISYLGYAATMGVPFIDYIVADPFAIPEAERAFYTEKIIYLPSHQVNDRKDDPPAQSFTRAQLGLPATGFVFACLNNTYKITPDVFARWMRILARVPDSALFVVAGDAPAANLKREAQRHGIDPTRVIVGKKAPTAEYWARLRAAGLFLDTAPFNGHSTASDALWAKLPVLTCQGRAYAARIAGSLLTALDLPELIATSWDDYEARAVELATNPERLAAVRDKLVHNRLTGPLFDTARFTRTLEAAYAEIMVRARAGQPPAHIFIPP